MLQTSPGFSGSNLLGRALPSNSAGWPLLSEEASDLLVSFGDGGSDS